MKWFSAVHSCSALRPPLLAMWKPAFCSFRGSPSHSGSLFPRFFCVSNWLSLQAETLKKGPLQCVNQRLLVTQCCDVSASWSATLYLFTGDTFLWKKNKTQAWNRGCPDWSFVFSPHAYEETEGIFGTILSPVLFAASVKKTSNLSFLWWDSLHLWPRSDQPLCFLCSS